MRLSKTYWGAKMTQISTASKKPRNPIEQSHPGPRAQSGYSQTPLIKTETAAMPSGKTEVIEEVCEIEHSLLAFFKESSGKHNIIRQRSREMFTMLSNIWEDDLVVGTPHTMLLGSAHKRLLQYSCHFLFANARHNWLSGLFI